MAKTKPCERPAVRVDDGRGLPLIPSAATQQQVSDLAGGYCHALALVLHERHSWQIRALDSPADEYSMRPWGALSGLPRHIYCLNDAGLPVDVNGVFASEDAIRRYYAHQHCHDETLISADLSADDVRGELIDRGYRRLGEHELTLTRRYADRLALHTLTAPGA